MISDPAIKHKVRDSSGVIPEQAKSRWLAENSAHCAESLGKLDTASGIALSLGSGMARVENLVNAAM